MSSVIADFNREDFFEQGFKFTKVGEKTWSVEVLESWSSLGETWQVIGNVIHGHRAPGFNHRGMGDWASTSDNMIYVGFVSRHDAAAELERIYYARPRSTH